MPLALRPYCKAYPLVLQRTRSTPQHVPRAVTVLLRHVRDGPGRGARRSGLALAAL
jgi:hypothetical protein